MVCLDYLKISEFCRRERIVLPVTWKHSVNAIRYHDSRESMNHFLVKCAIAHELMSRGQTILSEIKLSTKHEQPVADLLWLDEKIVIEFESQYSEEKARIKLQQFGAYNTLVFDIKSKDTEEMLETIKRIKIKLGLV